jgi:catechol 2,3-dioxygenase
MTGAARARIMIPILEKWGAGIGGMTNSNWPLLGLTLKVLDLDAQAAFYQRFGFAEISRTEDECVLGVGTAPLLRLRRLAGGQPRPHRSAGLFHFAILVPDERTLGTFLEHAARERFPYVGAGDHLVSQALYFEDPEGNGIEVYADRPREVWTYDGAQVRMATLPVDLDRLAQLSSGEWTGFPEGTVLGHMHLTVGDLDRAEAHYRTLGMDVTASLGEFFRFMSWDGYHHHLGLNLANGRGALPVSPEVAGVEGFNIRREGVEAALGTDPDGMTVS